MHHSSAVAELVGGTVALLLVAAAILTLCKRLRLPFTVVLVIVGILLTSLTDNQPELSHILSRLELSPDLILYVFLPTLIFESSINLDVRQLRHNLAPIAMLAIPGLIISTSLIGIIVYWTTSIPLVPALLLGAILSATDPVAVVALFRQLGAPQRLTVLVEGESLFNDATSIVLARILIGVIAAGSLDNISFGSSLVDFFVLFFGGLLVGIFLGWFTGWLIGLVESEPFVEITLTTVLAYLSFLIAEELLGLSGVMATVGAGLTLGGWGRTRISSSVRIYLEQFWELMAFIANALIFLMLGLKLEIPALIDSLDLLVWVIVAMFIARAVMVYGLMPLVGKLPGSRKVSLAYQTVMFWGGLRGAIAIAIVLSLPHFEYADTFIALVMGVVLFTLIVQGLSIKPLMHWLKLDQIPLVDRLALLERDLFARQKAIKRIPNLVSGGLFSLPISRRLEHEIQNGIHEAQLALDKMRHHELTEKQELNFLYLNAFSEEKNLYDELFSDGHLSEGAYRELVLVLQLQIDAIRHSGAFAHIHSHRAHRLVEQIIYQFLDRFSLLSPLAEHFRMKRIIRNYEEVWGHYQGSERVLKYLQELQTLESTPQKLIDEVRAHYRHWHDLARHQINLVSENFPEFINSMQQRLGKRLILLAEADATEELLERGMLPRGSSEEHLQEIATQLNRLRGQSITKLEPGSYQLLRKVPLFHDLPTGVFKQIETMVIKHTLPEDEIIINQDEDVTSLYLIARGLVRVLREEDGRMKELGSLMAGDFFGEMALMRHEGQKVQMRSESPCVIYELKRDNLEELMQQQPEIAGTLQQTDDERRRQLRIGQYGNNNS